MEVIVPDNGCTVSGEIHLKPQGFALLTSAGVKQSEDDGELMIGVSERSTGLFYHPEIDQILSRHPEDSESQTSEHLSDGRGLRPFMVVLQKSDAATNYTVIRTGASQDDIELWTLEGGKYAHYKMMEVS